MKAGRKINSGISTVLVNSKSKLRAYAFYIELAGLTKNRSIHNYESRIRQLSKTLGVCVPTFKKWLTVILKKKWAWIENGCLRFLGRRKLAKILGAARTQYVTIEATSFKDIELHIRALAIEENKSAQRYRLNQKILKRYTSKIHCNVIKKKVARLCDVDAEKRKLREVNVLTPINKNITLSRKGIAKIFDLKSKFSGSYWITKMKKAGVVKDSPQEKKYLGRMSKDYFRELSLTSKRHLYYEGGVAWVRMPNRVDRIQNLRLQ